jgi:hypothetical protein
MRIGLATIGFTAGLVSLSHLISRWSQPGEAPIFENQVEGEGNKVLVEPGMVQHGLMSLVMAVLGADHQNGLRASHREIFLPFSPP